MEKLFRLWVDWQVWYRYWRAERHGKLSAWLRAWWSTWLDWRSGAELPEEGDLDDSDFDE